MRPGEDKATPTEWFAILFVILMLFYLASQALQSGDAGRAPLDEQAVAQGLSDEIRSLQDRMLAPLSVVGATALCLQEFGAVPGLEDATKQFNERNWTQMEALVAEVEKAGGMSRAEKELLDRRGYREVDKLFGGQEATAENCAALATRIDAGEFDM